METADSVINHLSEVARASHNHWIAGFGMVCGAVSAAMRIYAIHAWIRRR